MRVFAVALLVGCGGAPAEPAKTVELGRATQKVTGRESPVVVLVQKGIARHVPNAAAIDLHGTAYANDAIVFGALRRETDVDLAARVLDAVGLSAEAAERRAGKPRPSCWYGSPKARTSNAGLGVTVDERYQTASHLFLGARAAIVVMDRALKIDASPAERKNPSFMTWELSVVSPLATMSIGVVEVTGDRRKPEIANAWRTAWKEILVVPKGAKPAEEAPDGEGMAGSFLGFLGRFVPQAEYDAAGKQMAALKSPEAHAVNFRIADLGARSVLPIVMEQMEEAEIAKELRALDPIRSKETLVAARAVVDRAVKKAHDVVTRTTALCTVVQPVLAESAPDAAPEDVERYLAALDSAFVVGVPGLEAATLAFFEKLVTLARGR